MTSSFAITATCPKGLEELLADELLALGASISKRHVAGVTVEATLEVAYRCCLWSRLANRILMPLTKFRIDSAAALYDGIAAIQWCDHFSPDQTFIVDFNGTNRAISNS